MTALPQPRTMSPEEFLAWEATQESRHEFVDGEIFAMTGGTLFHNIIAFNLATILRQQLEPRGCLTFIENAKLRAGTNIFYPDVVVTCDPHQLDRDLIEHPILVAEVLSHSTATYDRETKWVRCRQHLPSLQAFLLVSQASGRPVPPHCDRLALQRTHRRRRLVRAVRPALPPRPRRHLQRPARPPQRPHLNSVGLSRDPTLYAA